jgi:hypothetical protein
VLPSSAGVAVVTTAGGLVVESGLVLLLAVCAFEVVGAAVVVGVEDIWSGGSRVGNGTKWRFFDNKCSLLESAVVLFWGDYFQLKRFCKNSF